MSLSLSALTVIVLVNVWVTIALWLEYARRSPQPKLKKKFINQLLSFSSKPITPKHQPPKPESLNPNHQRFFDDFADFANIINAGFEGWSAWRLQELPETEYRFFPVAPPTADRNYAVFYNQARVGELTIVPNPYRGDSLSVATYIHLNYARLLPFDTIRDFLKSIAGDVVNFDSKEYPQALQAIDHAMMKTLWRSNQLDVWNSRPPADLGEINLEFKGTPCGYLDHRNFLRNQAASKIAATTT